MNLLRIHSISILILLLICILITNATQELNKIKDSRILRIKTLPFKHNSHKDDQPYQIHETDNKSNSQEKKVHLNNKQLLSKLGLSKIRIPSSHSRKRLAVESRHHSRPDDSHMFVIKLPPNPYYYVNNKPGSSSMKNSIDDNVKNKVSSFGFRSNGKPGRIYHWNIPVLKKIINDDKRGPTPRHNDRVSDLIDIKNIPTWSKPWENDTIDKGYGKFTSSNDGRGGNSQKRKTPSYYAPANHNNNNKKNNFHKYFRVMENRKVFM